MARPSSFRRQLAQLWKGLVAEGRPLQRRIAAAEKRLAEIEARQRGIESALRSPRAKLAAAGQELTPDAVDNALRILGQKLQGNQPHFSYFNERFRDYETALLNVKNLGYELGCALAERQLRSTPVAPSAAKLNSKLCTQSDFESSWFIYWCQEIRTIPLYHRKFWEFCYICQVLFVEGMLAPGRCGLGFGCGEEPLPSLFAKYGVKVLATDLDPGQEKSAIWRMTREHGESVETYRRRDICPDEELLANINFRPVDMKDLPHDLDGQFDFCWSACAFEHLGRVANGLEFVENSLRMLKPGGIAVHTTEFTFEDGETIDNSPTVLYQKRHLVELAERLRAKGHQVADFDFDPGDGIMDRLVDVPPWRHHLLMPPAAHLKLSVDGFTCTSAGMVVRA